MITPTATQRKRAVFHERRTYRQRRIMDAARILPVLGLGLWLVPLLWPLESEAGVQSSGALIYVFGVWAGLIGIAALLSFGLSDRSAEAGDDGA